MNLATPILSFEDVRQITAADLEQVNALILDNLTADVPLAQQIGEYIFASGGKRLRPIVTLLGAKACGYEGRDHISLAAIVELIHTATLLHDDVVDASSLRRGKPTANALWGNQASVLVGDFLYSRAFQLMAGLNSLPVMSLLADASNTISQGEVLQLMYRRNPETTQEHYLEVIRRKTAVLFAAAAELGAIIAGSNQTQQAALQSYGLHLGMAFQMTDDYLDYAVSAETLGKNLGDDLAEGKVTLPLIYAMRHAESADAQLIHRAISQGGIEDFPAILSILQKTRALDYVLEQAQRQADIALLALENLPENDFSQALNALTNIAIHRKS